MCSMDLTLNMSRDEPDAAHPACQVCSCHCHAYIIASNSTLFCIHADKIWSINRGGANIFGTGEAGAGTCIWQLFISAAAGVPDDAPGRIADLCWWVKCCCQCFMMQQAGYYQILAYRISVRLSDDEPQMRDLHCSWHLIASNHSLARLFAGQVHA